MIIPDSFLDLDSSVVRISSVILKILNVKKILSYDDLVKILIEKEGDNVLFVLLNSLSFLYMLGKIEYNLKTDTIERLK